MELDQTLIDDGDVLTAGGALAWPDDVWRRPSCSTPRAT
jgi:hypothetical protein